MARDEKARHDQQVVREYLRSMGADTPSGKQTTIVVGYDGTAPAEEAVQRAADPVIALITANQDKPPRRVEPTPPLREQPDGRRWVSLDQRERGPKSRRPPKPRDQAEASLPCVPCGTSLSASTARNLLSAESATAALTTAAAKCTRPTVK